MSSRRRRHEIKKKKEKKKEKRRAVKRNVTRLRASPRSHLTTRCPAGTCRRLLRGMLLVSLLLVAPHCGDGERTKTTARGEEERRTRCATFCDYKMSTHETENSKSLHIAAVTLPPCPTVPPSSAALQLAMYLHLVRYSTFEGTDSIVSISLQYRLIGKFHTTSPFS